MNSTGITFCDAPTVPEIPHAMGQPHIDDALSVGFELYGYRINQVIGHGQIHISYLAMEMNKGSDQPFQVILKEYFPCSLVSREPSGVVKPKTAAARSEFEVGKRHFLREASFLMAIEHPALVHVDAVFTKNGSFYMVMPYKSGETLFSILNRKRRINQQGLLDLFFSLSEGLEFIHEHGCIHRDLKPSNIFIQESGQPVILDFGEARFADEENLTRLSMISPGYTPIESYSINFTDQGPWTDIYSLAAVLYKGITGRAPIDAVERGQKILKDLEDPYQSLISVASDQYTLRFLSAVDHGLCFRAEDRPQSMTDWVAEFDGTVPVWMAAEQVKKDLLIETARRSLDFDLNHS